MSKKKKQDQERSPAYRLVQMVWEHANRGVHKRSWDRLNQSMGKALRLAIYAGMEFELGDIKSISADFRGDKVRIGIEAPSHVDVHREEVWLKIRNGEPQRRKGQE